MAVYMAAMALITIVATALARETYREGIDAEREIVYTGRRIGEPAAVEREETGTRR